MSLFSLVVGYAVEKYLNSKNIVAVHQVMVDGKPETIMSGFAPGIEINSADGENLIIENIKGASNFKVAIGGVNQLIAPDTARGERRFYSVAEDGKTIKAVIKLFNDGEVKVSNANGSVSLGADGVHTFNGGSKESARNGDKVLVTIPAGTYIESVSGGSGSPAVGVPNALPLDVEGTIQEGTVKVLLP